MTGGRDPITLDVMIIGAGPSALMAADYLAHTGRRVVLMEGKASPARKFLMAGKSGLNLTMDEPLEAFLAAYGPSAAPLTPMIRTFGPEDVMRFTRDTLGQPIFTGSSRRVFP
ncbi:MAG: NAD(P)/FAD-dependent oxidoreductase, partial [Paracoccaceae bacterium]